MRTLCSLACLAALALVAAAPARADDNDKTKPILDKAIKALGGEDKLSKIHAASWKSKGTLSIMGNDNPMSTHTSVQGLSQFRQEIELEIMGNKVNGVTVINGNKGWTKFGDMEMELEENLLANGKRAVYLAVIPITIVPLKGKGFKTELAGAEKVGDKPADVIKVTGPDGKDFKLYFDKESGLPVKLVAKVLNFMGDEVTQETTFGSYKEMGGIKKATKEEVKHNGEKLFDFEITEFKPVDKFPEKTFAKPE
jgi:hypothetical protein